MKIVLAQNPTFDGIVQLDLPGREQTIEVGFVFKVLERKRMIELLRLSGMDKKANWLQRVYAYLSFRRRIKKKPTVLDMLDEIVCSWEVADGENKKGFDVPYSRDAMRTLIQEFPGAHLSIFFSFLENHRAARIKN